MRMRDVAKAVGVSAMTVSRALREDASIAPATRKAVLEAIQRLGYVPDMAAGSLSSRRSGFVAVLVPSLNNPHFSETVLALSRLLEDSGLQLLIGDTDYRREREEDLVRAFLARKPEAIILTPDGHTPQTLRLLRAAKVPVIEMWETPDTPVQHVVGFSNRLAMRDLVATLASTGYRRITFIGETDDAGTRGMARREGYLDALRQSGLGAPRLCHLGRPPATMSDGETALGFVQERFPDTDLVVCVSDPLAFGVISACRRRGVSVPGDIAVAGFGDFEISRISKPTITTVAVSPSSMARELAAQLTDILRAPGLEAMPSGHRLVSFDLLMRESAPAKLAPPRNVTAKPGP